MIKLIHADKANEMLDDECKRQTDIVLQCDKLWDFINDKIKDAISKGSREANFLYSEMFNIIQQLNNPEESLSLDFQYMRIAFKIIRKAGYKVDYIEMQVIGNFDSEIREDYNISLKW